MPYGSAEIDAALEFVRFRTEEAIEAVEWIQKPTEQRIACYLVGTRIGRPVKGIRRVNVMSQANVGDSTLRDNFQQLAGKEQYMPASDAAALLAIERFRKELVEPLDASLRSVDGKQMGTYRDRQLKESLYFSVFRAVNHIDDLILSLDRLAHALV